MADNVKSISGTQTERNLMKAYIGESVAYTSYTYFAKQANKEGYYPIEQIFNETADNELHHAKVYLKRTLGVEIEVPMVVNPGNISDTATNLAVAIAEEGDEAENYRSYADTARKEGFDDIASHFDAIAEIELHHKARFEAWLAQVKAGTVWKRDHAIKWRCLVCGYIYEGTEPPQVCPGCDHPYQHYMAMDMLTL